MTPFYIGLHGLACSGKDTTYTYLREKIDGTRRYGFADKLKEMAVHILFDLTGESIDPNAKDPRVRKFLQTFATDVCREWDPDIWVKYVFTQIDGVLAASAINRKLTQPRGFVFTDVRFPNEVEAIKARGGIVCRVWCPEEFRAERLLRLYGDDGSATSGHKSESSLADYAFDYVINTTTPRTMQEDVGRLIRAENNRIWPIAVPAA